MPTSNIHLAALLRGANVPVGPMIVPSPGPTFAMDVAAALMLEIKSKPVIDRASVINPKEEIITKKNK